MRIRALAVASVCLAGLVGCAAGPGTARPEGAEWEVIGLDQVKRIAEIRESLDALRLGFQDVVIIRMTTDEQKRVEITSIAPTIVSAQKDGAPAARTTFAMTEKRERVLMLTQDVPNRKAFYREIPAAELTGGRSFRFPVVQESGRILEQTFTVQQVIVR
jgi:hypothetical protein